MTTTTKSKPIRLTMRDLDVLRSLALYKRLSTQQIRRLHFPNTHELMANKRMLELRGTHRDPSEQYVSRVFSYPKASEYEHGGRKTAIYHLTPTNTRNIMRHLSQRGQPELAGELQDLPTIETGTTSHKHLTHELGISEFFITLHEAAQDTGNTIPFWEQTSTAKYFQEERFKKDAQLTSNAAIPAHGWLVLYERCRNVSRGFIERTHLLILKRHAHEKGCPTWSDAASGRRFDAAPPKSSTLDGLDRRIAMVCGGAVD